MPPGIHRSHVHPLSIIFSRESPRGAPLDLPAKLPPNPNPERSWRNITWRANQTGEPAVTSQFRVLSGPSGSSTGLAGRLLPPSRLESRCGIQPSFPLSPSLLQARLVPPSGNRELSFCCFNVILYRRTFVAWPFGCRRMLFGSVSSSLRRSVCAVVKVTLSVSVFWSLVGLARS